MVSFSIVFGEFPKKSASSKSIAVSFLELDLTKNLPLSITLPTLYIGARSLSQISFNLLKSFSEITKPILS